MRAYVPALPTSAEHHRAAARQLLALPPTLARIGRIIREDYAPASLDEYLWAFVAFHEDSGDPHYRARTWQKAAFHAIHAGQVIGMPASELALMLHVAMEIEAPIAAYSRQTGEGFRVLLPALSRFMGRSEAQARLAEERGEAWCESCWCAEERRHAPASARLIERLTGMTPQRDNPNVPIPVSPDEREALKLLAGRESSEWNASSVYVVLAAHATGELHTVIRNVARDEIKHLAILSALDRYLLGPRPWGRFADLIATARAQYRGHQRRRSAGDYIGTNRISAVEVIVAHLLAERRIRGWLASLPLHALTAVFEPPPAPIGEDARSPGLDTEDGDALRAAGKRRRELAHWAPGSRAAAIAQRAWEAAAADTIDRVMVDDLDGLAHAGLPGSGDDRQTRRRIRRVASGPLRVALTGRLRQRQIALNRYVQARRS
jgi:hypothetical protein